MSSAPKPRRIAIGSDHAGFELKEWLKAKLVEAGYECQDFGTNSPQSCDYPDFSFAVAQAVVSGQCDTGILVCGTGIGTSIAAIKSVVLAVLYAGTNIPHEWLVPTTMPTS
jgi:ribose-5-phosphate isomerase (EC 5.3.1.6)